MLVFAFAGVEPAGIVLESASSAGNCVFAVAAKVVVVTCLTLLGNNIVLEVGAVISSGLLESNSFGDPV